jgi:regulator of sigma E protease
MRVLLGLIALFMCLFLVVGLHEIGHALSARFFHIKIQIISLGFGKPLLRWYGKTGTEWRISSWLIGGYVKLLNTRIEPVLAHEEQYAFDKQPIFVRCIVLISGVAINFLVGWLALVFMLMLGFQQIRPVIKSVNSESVAAIAGLHASDKIISISGRKVSSWRDSGMELIKGFEKGKVDIVIETKEGVIRDLELNLSKDIFAKTHKSLLLGLGIEPDVSKEMVQTVAGLSFIEACMMAFWQMGYLLSFYLMLLKELLTGVIPLGVLLGPISVFSSLVNSFFQGLAIFGYFVANLSFTVALVNLFPIPGLDGGLILYALIEKIRGKPISVRLEVLLHRLIFIAFSLVLLQLLLNDAMRFFV